MAEGAEDEPTDCVPVLVGKLQLQEFVDVADGRSALDEVVAVGLTLNLVLLDVIFVDDLADKFFEAVLEGDQPGQAAVLVGNDRQMELLSLHLPHQAGNGFVLGDEPDRSHDVDGRRSTAAGTLG